MHFNPVIGIFVKRKCGQNVKKRRMPNDYRSRNQADVKGCQKLPATAKSQGHMWKNTPQGCQRGYNPVNTFISDFWPTELVQFSSVSQWCPTLCDQMDCSMLGFPVLQQLPELAQTHVHQVDDPIQPNHPLFSPSPPAFNLSQHQGLFQCISSSHQVAKVMEFQLQHQSFQ